MCCANFFEAIALIAVCCCCCCCRLECALINCGINEYWMDRIGDSDLAVDGCMYSICSGSIRTGMEYRSIVALSSSGSGSSRGLREAFHSSKMMPTQKILEATVLPPVGIPEPQRD